MDMPAAKETSNAFEALNVLDVGSFLAAPAAATLFGDQGAQVIKVEAISGDPWRNTGARKPGDKAAHQWRLIGRNKRSLAIDLKSAEGQAILVRLVGECDVLITNLPARSLASLKLDYDTVRAANPRIVYGLVTAYGEEGPDAAVPGYDTTAWWARSGLMHWMRSSDDAPPSKLGLGLGDQMSGLSLFSGLCAALYRRERTGEGAKVTTSLLSTALWGNGVATQAAIEGEDLAPLRAAIPANPCAFRYQCADGRWFVVLMLGAQADALWPTLARIAGLDALANDKALATLAGRKIAAPVIVAQLGEAFRKKPSAEWLGLLDEARIPCSLMQSVEEAIEDPQVAANALLEPTSADARPVVASPITISGSGRATHREAPSLGEHSRAILRELAISDGEIDELERRGIVRS